MLPSTKDRNGFLGIILKIVFQNPDKFLYSCKFGSCLNRCLISLIFSPKWKTLPKNKPNTIAKTVDIKKKDKTNKAIFVGDLILTKLEAPEINENRTNGTTSIFIN